MGGFPSANEGFRDDAGKYKPKSLTSPGKIAVYNKITKHRDNHSLLEKIWHGFCKGKSCLTNLLAFYHSVKEQADKGDSVDMIYLNFHKASVRVPH